MQTTWGPKALGDDLKGKRVLITGSSRGIGAALALAFAGHGARVAVHGHHSREAAAEVVETIRSMGERPVLVMGDVRDAAALKSAVEDAAAGLGGLDILINNAGTMVGRKLLDEQDEAFVDEVIGINVLSVVHATRFALPALKASGRASIVNTSSISARQGGGPGSSIYAASKAFVSTFTRSSAKELASFGIRVNAVSPGTIATDFHKQYSTPERLAKVAETIPMKRIGEAEDCVGAYLFLASERLAGYVTGQIVEVNGGQFVG
jgi:3-oxoacyl-[acyl-carrier protein] reductase